MGPAFKKACAKLLKLFNYMQLCKMKNIKAIIFDLGGVIYNINYKKTIEELRKLGIANSEFLYSQKRQSKLFDDFETGQISNYDFLNKLQQKTNNASLKQIKKAWNAMLLDLPIQRLNTLHKLKKKYSIFLLSNTNEIHINKIKEILGEKKFFEFYNLFNKIYFSHIIKKRKPNFDAFQLILIENKLMANEVLFIDDSIQHIESAKQLNINTLHLKQNQEITSVLSGLAQ